MTSVMRLVFVSLFICSIGMEKSQAKEPDESILQWRDQDGGEMVGDVASVLGLRQMLIFTSQHPSLYPGKSTIDSNDDHVDDEESDDRDVYDDASDDSSGVNVYKNITEGLANAAMLSGNKEDTVIPENETGPNNDDYGKSKVIEDLETIRQNNTEEDQFAGTHKVNSTSEVRGKARGGSIDIRISDSTIPGLTGMVKNDTNSTNNARKKRDAEGHEEKTRGTMSSLSDEVERVISWLVDTGEGTAGVLVVGESEWIVSLVSLIKRKMLLGPGNVLLLLSTSGEVSSSHLMPQIRLAAKVILLERKQRLSGRTSDVNKCYGMVKQAILVKGPRYKLKTVGCWRGVDHGLILSEELLPNYTTLYGSEVTVVIVKNFIEAIRVGPGGRFLVGYLGKVVTSLAKSLHFRYSIMDGSSFGTLTPNGSFDGVVGHIERKEGDIGLASLSISYYRRRAIDYTEWIMYHPSLFVTRAPRLFKDPLILFKIFTWQGWCTIAGFLIFAGTCLWLFWFEFSESLETRSSDQILRSQSYKQPTAQKQRKFVQSITTVLKAAVYQGSNHSPSTSSGRIVYVSSWLIVMIIYAVYSGNLTAFLSIPRVDHPPATVHELVIRNWAFSLDKAFGSHDLVKATKTEDYQTLYKRAADRGYIKENVGAKARTDYNDLLYNDIAAVMGETGAFYNLNVNRLDDGRCKLTYGREDIGKEYAGLALPKMSLLKPLFDKKLLWMRQMGIIQKYYDDAFGVKCFRRLQDTGERKAMALYQLVGVFYMWLVGIFAALIAFFVELKMGKDENSWAKPSIRVVLAKD